MLVWYVFEGPTTKPQEVFGCLASQIPGLQPENSTSRASHVLKGELVWWVDIRIYSMFSGSWLLVLSISHKNLVLKIDLYILEQKHESWDQKYIAYTFASGMPFWSSTLRETLRHLWLNLMAVARSQAAWITSTNKLPPTTLSLNGKFPCKPTTICRLHAAMAMEMEVGSWRKLW